MGLDEPTAADLKRAAAESDARGPWHADIASEWRRFAEGIRALVTFESAQGRTRIVLASTAPGDTRTTRRNRIVSMLCAGASGKQVAMELGSGQPTVSKQVRHALRGLDIDSPVALVNALGPWAMSVADEGRRPRGERVSAFRANGRAYIVVGFDCSEARSHPSLTPAERAVVELVSRGLTNGAIARLRRRSPRTIANQLARTFDKLGVRSRVELLIALRTDPQRDEGRRPARSDHGPGIVDVDRVDRR